MFNLKQLVSIDLMNINDDKFTPEFKKNSEYTTVLIIGFVNGKYKRFYYIDKNDAVKELERIKNIIGEQYFI
jgi:hypothetical protein